MPNETGKFHAVKEAAIADAASKFGLRGMDVMRRLGQFLGSAHPALPKGYGPGLVDSLKNGGPLLHGLGNNLKNMGHGLGEGIRSHLIGNPAEIVSRLKDRAGEIGGAGAIGEHVKHTFLPPDLTKPVIGAAGAGASAFQNSTGGLGQRLMDSVKGVGQGWQNASAGVSKWQQAGRAGLLGLNVGLPAYELYSAAKSPENRGRNIGSAIAGLGALPFTAHMGSPLAGQFGLGLGSAVNHLARRAGGAVGSLFDSPTPPPPASNYPSLSNTLRSH
jgi:hypothetical protein